MAAKLPFSAPFVAPQAPNLLETAWQRAKADTKVLSLNSLWGLLVMGGLATGGGELAPYVSRHWSEGLRLPFVIAGGVIGAGIGVCAFLGVQLALATKHQRNDLRRFVAKQQQRPKVRVIPLTKRLDALIREGMGIREEAKHAEITIELIDKAFNWLSRTAGALASHAPAYLEDFMGVTHQPTPPPSAAPGARVIDAIEPRLQALRKIRKELGG